MDLSRGGTFRYVVGHLLPPTCLIAVLLYVLNGPRRVAAFASSFEKPVKHVAFGHTHRAGAWLRDGVHYYNTGSFMPLSRAHVISVKGEQVRFAALGEALTSWKGQAKPS